MEISLTNKTNDATTDTHSIFAYKGTTSIWILQTFWQLFFIAQMAKFSKTKRQHTEYMLFDTKKRNLKSSQKIPTAHIRTVGTILLHFCIIPVKRIHSPTSDIQHLTL